jgi:hypothetical protein
MFSVSSAQCRSPIRTFHEWLNAPSVKGGIAPVSLSDDDENAALHSINAVSLSATLLASRVWQRCVYSSPAPFPSPIFKLLNLVTVHVKATLTFASSAKVIKV